MSPRVVAIDPLDERNVSAWDAYVTTHARGTLYHTAAWHRLIRDLFGHDVHHLAALDGTGSFTGVLPLVRLNSPLFGHFLVSLPYVNYGGAIGADPEVEDALMSEAIAVAQRHRAQHIEFRDTVPRRGEHWRPRTDKVIMELPLPDSSDALFKTFDSKLRSQIRRPLKEDATALHGGLDLLADFYAVFSRNMRDLGTPVYAKRLFARILQTFPTAASITVVRLKGFPVAAGFLLSHRGRMEIPWASSIREYNRIGANMLLYWEVMRRAVESGHSTFDFGRSTRDGSVYRFKRQWGAQPRQCYWHYWLSPDRPERPALTPDNPRYRLAIGIWKKLPLAVANRLGPSIVKYLP